MEDDDGNVTEYDPVTDPDGKCAVPSGGTPDQRCLLDNYPYGTDNSYADCRSAARQAECLAAVNSGEKYNDDPCFSPMSAQQLSSGGQGGSTAVVDKNGNPVYDSADCKTKRGIADCESKNNSQTTEDENRGAYVYLRAFGTDPENSCVTFVGFSRTIIDYALLIAALIAGGMLLKGGFKYTVSRGNAVALMEARDEIIHASIGVMILAVAYVAILFLQGSLGFLGLDLIGPFKYLLGQ